MLQWFRKQAEEEQANRSNGDLHVALTRKLVDFLASQISQPKRATAIMSQIARFKELPPTYQEKELPSLYLKIEKYLVHDDPMQKFTRTQLRKTVRYRYEPLMEMANFSVIFQDESVQELTLSQFMFKNLILRSTNLANVLGEDFLNSLAEWIYCFPEVKHLTPPFEINVGNPQNHADWIEILRQFSQQFYLHLEKHAGTQEAGSLYEKSYRDLVDAYRLLESFSVVVQLLPDELLDEQKVGFLSGEQIRHVFLNKVAHLKHINDELAAKNDELNDAREELEIAQDTAMESVKLFHAVLDTIEEGIVTIDASGNILLVNEQIQKMFGYEEDELVGKSVQSLMPEKYREQHRKGMERYFRTRQSNAMGQRLKLEGMRKNQTIFPLEIFLTEAVISEQVYFTAAMRDLSEDVRHESERKKTADNLRQSEQRLRTYFESSKDMIFTLSLDGTFTSANTSFETITGLDREQWMAKPFTQLVHPDDSKLALKLFQNVLQGVQGQPAEVRMRKHDDKYIHCEVTLLPELQEGKMMGGFGFARDVSDRKKVEESLRRSEDRYRKLLEIVPDGMGIHINGNIVHMNDQGAVLLGSEEGKQLLNKSLLSFVPAEDRQQFRDQLVEMLKSNTPQPLTEIKMLRTDKREVMLELASTPIIFQGKRAAQILLRSASTAAAPTPATTADTTYLEQLPTPAFILNSEGSILATNTAACDFHGLDLEAITGKNYQQLLPRSERETVMAFANAASNSNRKTIPTTCLKNDGSQLAVLLSVATTRFEEQDAVLLLAHDSSIWEEIEHDRKHTAAELLKTQSRLKRLGKLIPICTSCKNLRDDQQFWMELEEFAGNPENLELIKGKCPDCNNRVSIDSNNISNGLNEN